MLVTLYHYTTRFRSRVQYSMATGSAEYLAKVLEAARTRPEVRSMIDAMHHVLAGGSVSVEVTKPGDAAEVAALDAQRLEALQRANDVNAAAGTYLTLS